MSRVSSYPLIVPCSELFFSSDAPFNVILKADSSEFLKNQPLTLKCSAEANPAPFQYKWHKDGQIISGETGSQISFLSLDYDNSGTYDCIVNNSVGEAQSNGFVIAVNGMF